jgi:L-ribulose-5-phosphate 3-epimerase
MSVIAFNTANLVARVTGYRFELKQWGDQHARTVAQTDEAEWVAICQEIAACGYTALEVWAAHADPSVMDEARARLWRRILDDHGLNPIGYAGGLTEGAARVCQWMGIPAANGGLGGMDLETVQRLCNDGNLFFNYENHPEKSVAEILEKIGGGTDRIGVCIDSGWLGTQGVDAVDAVRQLGALVRHVHVKDVAGVGGHETCPLGTGVVDLEGMMVALKAQGYTGAWSWEDEPEDRNPFEVAVASHAWIQARI